MAKSHGHMYWSLIFTSIGSSSLYYHPYGVRWRHIPAVDVQVSNCCQGIIIRHDKAKTYWSDGMNRMKTSSNGNIFRIAGPLCGEFHRSPLNSPHSGQWRGALMFSLICAWINDWVNNREAGDLRRHRAQYYVIVMGTADHRTATELAVTVVVKLYFSHSDLHVNNCTRAIVKLLCFEQCLSCHYDPWTSSDLIIPDRQFSFALLLFIWQTSN